MNKLKLARRRPYGRATVLLSIPVTIYPLTHLK